MKSIATIGIFLVFALTLTGCGSQSNTNNQPSSAPSIISGSNQEQDSSSQEPAVNEAEQAKLKEQQFKESAQQIAYNDLARNPEKFKSQPAYFIGKVAQVSEKKNNVVLRVEVTKGEYDIWDDAIWVNYSRPDGQDRILEDDIVQIWGTIKGLRTYEAVLGNEISIPEVDAAYVTIGIPENNPSPQSDYSEEAEPSDSITEETVDPNASVQDDFAVYDELYANYEDALIEAINAGDFSLVEPMLLQGSSLYTSQKSLVEDLSKRGVTEELANYEILDAQENPDSGVIQMTVHEIVKVIKPDDESKADSTWVYTVTQNGEGMYQFSDIRKP